MQSPYYGDPMQASQSQRHNPGAFPVAHHPTQLNHRPDQLRRPSPLRVPIPQGPIRSYSDSPQIESPAGTSSPATIPEHHPLVSPTIPRAPASIRPPAVSSMANNPAMSQQSGRVPLRLDVDARGGGINVNRSRPLPSPQSDRVPRFGYSGLPSPSSPNILKMPVPEIPSGVRDQLAMEQRTSPVKASPVKAGPGSHHLAYPDSGQNSPYFQHIQNHTSSEHSPIRHTARTNQPYSNANEHAPVRSATDPTAAHSADPRLQHIPNTQQRDAVLDPGVGSVPPGYMPAGQAMAMPQPGASHQPRQSPGAGRQAPPLVVPTQASNIAGTSATAVNSPTSSSHSSSSQVSLPNSTASFASRHRRFGSDAAIPASTLTVDQFETVRRHASTQPHDPRVQLELAKLLCEASDHLANRYTDPFHPSTMEVDSRQQARNREAWTSQALKIAKKLAAKVQYPESMFFLGSVYSSGRYGVDMDYVKALEYYQKAAKLEHPEACYRIAVCEEFGVGTRKNVDKAVSWYKKAAMLGSVGSMYKLGMLSLLGSLEQPRDFNTGFMWLQRAAEKADSKNPHAVHELGLLYERSPLSTYTAGDIIPHSEAKALEHFYIAAKLGYAPSQARLGRAFEFGELGCSVDPEWSISWYSHAAQQGDSDAELGMAGWYWTGSPQLRKNDTEAFLWAERAAGKGNARAMYAVGYFCELGIGVHRDLNKSNKWYRLAAEKKHPRAMQKLKTMD